MSRSEYEFQTRQGKWADLWGKVLGAVGVGVVGIGVLLPVVSEVGRDMTCGTTAGAACSDTSEVLSEMEAAALLSVPLIIGGAALYLSAPKLDRKIALRNMLPQSIELGSEQMQWLVNDVRNYSPGAPVEPNL